MAPTFISYQPYLFRWDEADYLTRSIVVSRAFWGGDVKHLLGGMVGIRPPAMTLLGVPWGPLKSWDAAGKCFVTLAAVMSILAATSLYLLLRIGVKPILFAAASLCVFASLGPYPGGSTAHAWATGFMADSLFAWIALVAVLLIPYEARVHSLTVNGAALRGILWGAILSMGAMTKLNFLYFAVLILPILVVVKRRHEAPRHVGAALLGFVVATVPAAGYLAQWGQPAFQNASESSFGGVSKLFYVPFFSFVGTTLRESPGMALSLVLVLAAVAWVATKKKWLDRWPDAAAFLIMLGFCVIVLSAANRQIRYAFPAILALPFLAGILATTESEPVSNRPAALVSILVCCALLMAALPMRNRPDRESLRRSDALLAFAQQYHANNVLIATDSPTLNGPLVALARSISPTRLPNCDTLAYSAMYGVPIEEDIRTMASSDLIVFQDQKALFPPYTNVRVPEYERLVHQMAVGPVKLGDDMSVYVVRHTAGFASK